MKDLWSLFRRWFFFSLSLFFFFTCVCLIVPEPFAEKTIFAPLYSFCFFAKDQLTILMWVNFWALYSISLTYSFTSTSVLITVTVWKWQLLSCVRLCVTPWTAAYQAPLSMEFSRQEYWSGFYFSFFTAWEC